MLGQLSFLFCLVPIIVVHNLCLLFLRFCPSSTFLAEGQVYIERLFPYREAGRMQLIREYGQLLEEEYTDAGIAVKARVPREIYYRLI